MSEPTTDYPCKVCGQVLRSPGSLGGHMSTHRRRGQLDPSEPLKRVARAICGIPGCGVVVQQQGWCSAHYMRWQRHGDPLEGRPIVRGTVEELFWAQVDTRGPGCHEWTGHKAADGYGRCPGRWHENGSVTHIAAHRLAWILRHGPIPDGLFVLHHCDNRSCCRDDHLYLGDHRDNMRDMKERGRAARNVGVSNGQAKLTDEQVREIRSRIVAGEQLASIAKDYGVTASLVTHIKGGHRAEA